MALRRPVSGVISPIPITSGDDAKQRDYWCPDAKSGERVGYGGRYTARDEQRIGISPQATPTVIRAMRLPVLLFYGRRAHHDGGDRLDGYAGG